MNVQMEINSLKQRISELEKQVEQEQDFPRNGDDYWYMDGDIEVTDSEWDGGDWDQVRMSVGNVFKTKEQAEFAVEKLKVEAELLNLSVSWDLENTQYSFSFNWEFGEFNVEYPDYNQYPNSYYFYSIDDLQQTIETVGEERIKKYIFGEEG